MPENDTNTISDEQCQCASCCVVRTAIAHGTSQRPEVGSTDWMDALGKELARTATAMGKNSAMHEAPIALLAISLAIDKIKERESDTGSASIVLISETPENQG